MVDAEHEKVSGFSEAAKTMPATNGFVDKIGAAHQLLAACKEARAQFSSAENHTACVITDMLMLELQRMVAGDE